ASAEVDGEFVPGRPAIADVGAVQARVDVVLVGHLQGPAGTAGLPEQKCPDAVVPGSTRRLFTVARLGIDDLAALGDTAIEAESSLRTEAAGDELRLRLVQRLVVDVAAKPHVVFALIQLKLTTYCSCGSWR